MRKGNEEESEIRFVSTIKDNIPMEELLRKERDLAQQYLDLSGEIVVAIDPEENITMINRQGIKLLGFDDSEILGKNWFDNFLPDPNREEVRLVYRQLMQGHLSPVKYFENEVLTAGGELRTISWHNSVLTDDLNKITGTLSAGRDVTEIRKAEDALRERDMWLESILSSVHECSIVVYDLDGRITHLWGSPEQDELYGIRAADAVGHLASDLLPPAQSEILLGRLKHVIETGAKVLFDTLLTLPGGNFWQTLSLAPIKNTHDQVTGVVGFFLDITNRKLAEESLQQAHDELEQHIEHRTSELSAVVKSLKKEIIYRKQAEQDLIRSEKRNREAQRISRFGHWEWEIASGDLYWSDEIFLIFGRKPQEFDATYDAFLETVHPDDRMLVESFVADALTGKRHYNVDHRIVLPDGEIRFVHEEADITRDENGSTILMTGTVQDITARKRAEIEVQKLQDELAHVARLNTMGEMGTGLAHELNQPLAAIVTYCFTGQKTLSDSDSVNLDLLRDLFSKLDKESMRASEIIRRLRAFVTKRAPEVQRIDIVETIREVLQLMDSDLRRNEISIELSIDHSDSIVTIDEIQIQQVLVNLIRNAMDAMVEIEHDRRTIKVSTSLRDDDFVEITVCDSGKGIPVESINQIFDAFFTNKPEGMGMGLAISRTIVESHKGQLWVTPNSGHGVTFHITLPVTKDESESE